MPSLHRGQAWRVNLTTGDATVDEVVIVTPAVRGVLPSRRRITLRSPLHEETWEQTPGRIERRWRGAWTTWLSDEALHSSETLLHEDATLGRVTLRAVPAEDACCAWTWQLEREALRVTETGTLCPGGIVSIARSGELQGLTWSESWRRMPAMDPRAP